MLYLEIFVSEGEFTAIYGLDKGRFQIEMKQNGNSDSCQVFHKKFVRKKSDFHIPTYLKFARLTGPSYHVFAFQSETVKHTIIKINSGIAKVSIKY